MYLKYFGLKEFPFSLVSDPRFLYLSKDHRRVKSYIEYAINIQDSFVVCTGEIGTGKTTLINDALTRIGPQITVARIQATKLSAIEFLQSVLIEFGFEPYDYSKVQMVEKLKQYLQMQHKKGKKIFLIIDEAQNLDQNILEDIRYLSDLESNNQKLMSIILVGQPELSEAIDKPEMEHLSQRIRLRFHIKALGINDCADYIRHRLRVAGSADVNLFEAECIPMIHQYTGGRLRLINTLCDYAMMFCCVEKLKKVDTWGIQKAANELGWESYDKRFGEKNDMTQFNIQAMPKVKKESKLIVNRNNSIVEEIKLDQECISIGRQMDNVIVLDDHKVSRYHAHVIAQGKSAYLHDLNSTNHTYLNKEKVNVHELKDGEEFSIGDFTISYVKGSEEEETHSHTRQMELDNRDKTRLQPKQPILSLVSSESAVMEEQGQD